MDEFDADVGSRPLLEAPTVAGLLQQIAKRPWWWLGEPHKADRDTFDRARSEMLDIQRQQGRALPTAPWLKQPNFLLHGIPVVMNDIEN